jgi:branched-chain amino acid transport system ATP-binding protein
MSAFFSVAGVSKRFRGLVAVDRASFEVARGEIFAVIGPNGAGKTTLFNTIAGAFSRTKVRSPSTTSASTGCGPIRFAAGVSRARSRSCGRSRL